jgi:hypothetical protein
MSVRPTLLKDIRRTPIQVHQANTGTGTYNRYELLNPRGRTFSVGKRQLEKSDYCDGNAPKTPKLDSNLVFEQLRDQDGIFKEVESALGEYEKECTNSPPDPKVVILHKVISLIAKSHKNLTSALIDSVKVATTPPAPGAGTGVGSGSGSNTGQVRNKPVPQPISEEEAAKRKVKAALKDAEKKTVLFNLNLGKNKVMNKDTISRKVTEALCNAANAGKHDYNIKDAEEVLDDILSCSKLEFLGTTTKPFFNNFNDKDPRNNNMQTIPVRMDFKDRETRFEAEIMLKKICQVKCAVPYPRRMRTLLNNLVKEGKTLKPDCFIRTKVNVENLTVEAHAKTGDGWLDLGLSRSIPLDILDRQPFFNNDTASQVNMDTASQIS